MTTITHCIVCRIGKPLPHRSLRPCVCRSVTTPFALAGATALGASTVLTASILSIGALYCAIFGMKLLQPVAPVSDPPEKNGARCFACNMLVGCKLLTAGVSERF